jgi:hypothetical protein
MLQINRNQAEEIFNSSEVINTKINQSENNLCLIFDFANGKHMQMNYIFLKGEKSYYLLEDDNKSEA